MPWLAIIFDFRILNLKEKRVLLRVRIILFSYCISRSANLNRLAGRELALVWLGLRGRVLGLAGGTLGEVGLVPLPLRVREVVPLVVVERQAELALIAAEMVSHEVGVLGEVDGLEREPAQALPPVDGLILGGGGAAAAGLGAPLAVHGVCSARPPLEGRIARPPASVR